MLNKAIAGIRGRLRRLKRADSGVAAIEFAFVAPPFIFMMGVLIETGLMLFAEYGLQTAVQDAARLVRTGQIHMNGTLDAQFQKAICDKAGIIIQNCTGSVAIYVGSSPNFATLKTKLPAIMSINTSMTVSSVPPACRFSGPPSNPAVVIASYDWKIVMPAMSFMSNVAGNKRRLIGLSMFQNEPFPPGAAGGTCP